jgi:phosphatidylglycerol---prolipoprotein diacylglyceryl transferase
MLEWWQSIPTTLDPIAFTLGFFSVYWYAVFFLAGFLAALFLALWLARRNDAPCFAECIFDLFLYIFFGALIGGRIGYVLFYNFDVFWDSPLRIFLPYDFERGMWVGISGMSYYGGIIGATLALYLFTRAKDLNFWKIADFAAFLAPIAIFFGRLGNFFNLELYGRITERPWGMIFPQVVPIGVLRHPSSLYEAFLEGVVIFIVLLFLRKKLSFEGALTCVYLALYAIFRFFVEFWREPDPQLGLFFNSSIGGFTLNQIFAFVLFCGTVAIFIWLKNQKRATIA